MLTVPSCLNRVQSQGIFAGSGGHEVDGFLRNLNLGPHQLLCAGAQFDQLPFQDEHFLGSINGDHTIFDAVAYQPSEVSAL